MHEAVISLSLSVSGPEEGGLSSSPSSRKEEQDVDMVTMATASLNMERGGGSTVGEVKRLWSREAETKGRTRGGVVPPDLDLDLVEEERRREVENTRPRKEGDRKWRKEEEERRTRSHTVRQRKRDNQRRQETRSRSFPRDSAMSWDAVHPEEQLAVGEEGGVRGRRSDTERAFSFLMPTDNGQHLSDSESAASYSEVSLSAASIASTGWRQGPDWRRAEYPWRQRHAPGPWLKPSPRRLTQVLIGSRLSGRELAGGLSL